MTTMNISLPKELKSFIDRQLKSGGYSTASEYVRELIRDAQKHAESRLEQLLLKGIRSGPAREMTSDDWRQIRRKALKRARSIKRR